MQNVNNTNWMQSILNRRANGFRSGFFKYWSSYNYLQ